MMVKHSSYCYFLKSAGLFISISLLIASCYKEPNYPCTVKVETQEGLKVEGAEVLLLALEDTFGIGETNAKGEISFEFDNAAVFDIKVTKDSIKEFGLVKLINHVNVEETIVLP